MIDVSRFRRGDRCPLCPGRRVYAVCEQDDLWRCVPNAIPVPFLKEHVIEHDAIASVDDPAAVQEFMRAAQLRTQVNHGE